MSAAAVTWVALLTPAGRGAIAVIGVRGPDALGLVAQHFRAASGRSLTRQRVGRIVFGQWLNSGAESPGEELIVCRTADNVVEVHCHGGHAAVEDIMGALVAAGAKRADTAQWLEREADDVLVQEALQALAAAATERAAVHLLAQVRGSLGAEIERIATALAQGDIAAAQDQVAKVLARARPGLFLASPFRVVLAGEPNVGKSSLINALLGFERAIVFDQPGTTRDPVAALTAIDGWPVELCDTAGWRESLDPLERAGMERAARLIDTADFVLWICDARDCSQPAATPPWLPASKARLLVWNKCDLADSLPAIGLTVSAATRAGLEALEAALAAAICPRPVASSEPLPFLPRHVAALQRCESCLQQQDAAGALAAMGELRAGASTREN